MHFSQLYQVRLDLQAQNLEVIHFHGDLYYYITVYQCLLMYVCTGDAVMHRCIAVHNGSIRIFILQKN